MFPRISRILLFAFVVAASMSASAGSAPSPEKARKAQITGYLVDVSCSHDEVEAGPAWGQKHTRACLLMPVCVRSGYAVLTQDNQVNRFDANGKLVAYSRLAPRVHQSGEHDRRGPLTKNGPRYLSWAFVEAAQHAHRHPAYSTLYNSTKARWGKQRGSQVATVAVARKLVIAVWHMLTREQPFAPPSATQGLAPSSAQV